MKFTFQGCSRPWLSKAFKPQANSKRTYFLVGVDINPIKLTESHKVCPHKDTKFLALTLSLLSIPRVTLVLYSYPQLVHLGKVQKHKGYRVFYSSILVFRFSSTIQQKVSKRSKCCFLNSGQCSYSSYSNYCTGCHLNWKKKRHISNKHKRLKSFNLQGADLLDICKHDQAVELACTKKQLQLSGQSRM